MRRFRVAPAVRVDAARVVRRVGVPVVPRVRCSSLRGVIVLSRLMRGVPGRRGRLSPVWARGVAAFVALALFGAGLGAGTPASADVAADRDVAVVDLTSGGPSVRRAAEAALVGS